MFNACGRRRGDPRFTGTFPKGPADVSQPRLRDQLATMNRYLPEWAKLAAKDAVVAEWLPKLTAGKDALSSALERLKAANDAADTAKWADFRARLACVATWDSNHGELMRRFPGDRVRVESYFPVVSPSRREAGEEEGPTETPPAGPTP
jgi:hypothetical protein